MAEDESKGMFEKLLENEKYRRVIVAVGVIGIALIFLSGLFQPEKKQEKAAAPQVQQTAQQYAAGLEESLTSLVENIQGAGSAKVLVTLERSAERVYATENKSSTQTQSEASDNSSETSYILIKDADGSQKALEVTEVQPIIKGVVIVCDGGNNPVVQQNIINAVTTALDLSSARVCVIKAK